MKKKPRFLYIVIILITVLFAFPLVWVLMSSFKTQIDIIASPPTFFFKPTLDNYISVFVENEFGRYLFNSTLIAVLSTFLSLVLGLPAAYSISRYKQKSVSIFILMARLVPGISFLIPWFILFSRLKMTDTFPTLIASHMMVGLPLVVLTMANFIDDLPYQLEEAARVDGCTIQEGFVRIILPLSTPGIVTCSTLTFIFSWNNFMFSLALSADKTKTLPLAIYNFVSYAQISWGRVMAAAVVIITPAIIITMLFQKYVVKGLTMGAIKG